MSDLKSCPFCGEKAELRYIKSKKIFARMRFPYASVYPYVSCSICGCRTEAKLTVEMAVERWNRRCAE